MPVAYQEPCPLRRRAAEYEFLDGEKGQHFYCVACKEFVLASIVKRKLLKENDKCLEYSELSASLKKDEFLHIFFDSTDTKKIQTKIERKNILRRM